MKKGLLALAAGMLLTAASASATTWGLVGDFNGWADDVEMTEVSEGVYTVTVETLEGQFKFRADGDWVVNYGAGATYEITNNGNYEVVADGQNFNVAEAVSNVTLTLDTNLLCLTVAGLEGEIVPPVDPTPVDPTPGEYAEIYLRGDMNGWGADAAYQFTTVDGVVYTLSLDSVSAVDTFKVADADWGTVNYGGDGVALELNTVYALAYNSSNNLQMGLDVTNVTFTFNLSDATLIVTGEGGDPLPPTPPTPEAGMYMIGAPWGWSATEGGAMDEISEGVYTITIALAANDYFGFCEELGSWTTINAKRYCPVTNGDVPVVGENVAVLGSDYSWMVDEAATYTFTLDTNTSVLTMSKATGVAGIGAENGEAVYFNLQGVRVANPENGLFIRVQNGKAVKVVK